jgi:hypothetical protein
MSGAIPLLHPYACMAYKGTALPLHAQNAEFFVKRAGVYTKQWAFKWLT